MASHAGPHQAVAATWTNLRERLEEAERTLRQMAEDCELSATGQVRRLRLLGKAEGIALALSYIRDYRADNSSPEERSSDCALGVCQWIGQCDGGCVGGNIGSSPEKDR